MIAAARVAVALATACAVASSAGAGESPPPAPPAPAAKPAADTAPAAAAAKWHDSLAAARAEAETSGRRILAVIGAGWYPSEPSRRLLAAVVAEDAAPGREGFVLFRVEEGETLPVSKPLGLEAEGHPYTALLEPDGTVTATLRGAWPAKRWAEEIRRLATAADARATAAAKVAAAPTDVRARWELSEALRALGRVAEADTELARAEALDAEAPGPLRAEFRFRRAEARYEDRVAVQDFTGAVAILDAYEKDFPNGPRRRWVALWRAVAVAYAGELDGAILDLEPLAADTADADLARTAADRLAALREVRDARGERK